MVSGSQTGTRIPNAQLKEMRLPHRKISEVSENLLLVILGLGSNLVSGLSLEEKAREGHSMFRSAWAESPWFPVTWITYWPGRMFPIVKLP